MVLGFLTAEQKKIEWTFVLEYVKSPVILATPRAASYIRCFNAINISTFLFQNPLQVTFTNNTIYNSDQTNKIGI